MIEFYEALARLAESIGDHRAAIQFLIMAAETRLSRLRVWLAWRAYSGEALPLS